MSRLFLLATLVLGLSACQFEASPAATEADAQADRPADNVVAEEPVADTPPPSASTDRAPARPAAPAAASDPDAGNAADPKRGVEVCEELEVALLAMRINGLDLDLYATQAVLDELRESTAFRDPETGQSDPADVASWVEDDHPGTCSLSAGGDAWYRVTLTSLSGGRGDYATAIETTASYAEGGP